MQDERFDKLNEEATKIKINNVKNLTETKKKLYLKFRGKLTDKNYIDKIIASAIYENKTYACIFLEKDNRRSIKISELIKNPILRLG